VSQPDAPVIPYLLGDAAPRFQSVTAIGATTWTEIFRRYATARARMWQRLVLGFEVFRDIGCEVDEFPEVHVHPRPTRSPRTALGSLGSAAMGVRP